MAEIKTGFGRRNVHCSNCGDERGGPFGHEASECQHYPGMSVFELTKMPHMAGREGEIWETYVDRYLDAELAAEQPEGSTPVEIYQSRSAGWVFRCHPCDITSPNLDLELAEQRAAVHLAKEHAGQSKGGTR